MNRSEHRIDPPTSLIIVLAVALAIVWSAAITADPDFLAAIRFRITDAIVATAPGTGTSDQVVVVDIDEASLAAWGQWPWPRSLIARLLDRLHAMGAASIALTVIMAEPDRGANAAAGEAEPVDGDTRLADTLAGGPFVLGYEFYFGDPPPKNKRCPVHPLELVSIRQPSNGHEPLRLYRARGTIANMDRFDRAVDASGFLNGMTDADGRLRRLPLLIDCGGSFYPNLALAALLPTVAHQPVKLKQRTGTQSCLVIDRYTIPIDNSGNLRVRFHPDGARLHHISADQILSGRADAAAVADRVVLVGLSASGLTPTYRAIGDDLYSAADVHAQAVETILSESHIRRHTGTAYAEVLLGFLVAVLYGYCIARLEFITTTLIGAAGVLSLWGIASLLFVSRQMLMSPLIPAGVIVTSGLFLMLLKYWMRQRRVRQRLQDALILIKSSENNLNAIIKTIPDIVFRLDATGRITFISPAVAKYKKRPEELIGRHILDLVVDNDKHNATFRINERRTGNRATTDLEVRLMLSPDDDETDGGRYFSVSAEGIYTQETPGSRSFVGTQGIARDIDDRKNLEQMLERSKKMEAIGSLAAGVAHDLNNILSGLVSYPELLMLDLPKDSPMRGKIEIIQRSGQRAADIVQDLLMIARRGVKDHAIINLNTVIGSYLKAPECLRLMENQPLIRIDTDLAADLMNIRGSSVHLQKMLMNLVSNAAEAMPAGGAIRLVTRNRYLDTAIDRYERIDEGDYVVLRVVDEGVGIPADDLRRIFEPFYTKKRMGHSGSGLGMTVIWNTVKDHGGFIDIRSHEGEGTSFEIFLPPTREAVGEQTDRVVLQDYTGSERILVVDDIAEQRDIAVRMLGKLGYHVDSAASGEAAVVWLQERSADLVVLDMVMPPGIDGLETYRRILAIRPAQKAIVASGYAPSERVKRMQALGAGEYIRKPYTLEKIGLAVRRELDRR